MGLPTHHDVDRAREAVQARLVEVPLAEADHVARPVGRDHTSAVQPERVLLPRERLDDDVNAAERRGQARAQQGVLPKEDKRGGGEATAVHFPAHVFWRPPVPYSPTPQMGRRVPSPGGRRERIGLAMGPISKGHARGAPPHAPSDSSHSRGEAPSSLTQ